MNLSIDTLRMCTKELIDSDNLYAVKLQGILYFAIGEIYSKSKKTVPFKLKANDLYDMSPKEIQEYLDGVGYVKYFPAKRNTPAFVKPTPEEVTEYAYEKGYLLDGNKFVDYYNRVSGESSKWLDSKGREIKSWKDKALKVWCKEDKKVVKLEGVPRGFEEFYVVDSKGKRYYPDGWRDGVPYSKDFEVNLKLRREYGKK